MLFADIVGFTAWSSVREPAQVFILLESVYHAFDRIAKKRRVFKVETIGDCYVAVVGLPDPRKNHVSPDICYVWCARNSRLNLTDHYFAFCFMFAIHPGCCNGKICLFVFNQNERSRQEIRGHVRVRVKEGSHLLSPCVTEYLLRKLFLIQS